MSTFWIALGLAAAVLASAFARVIPSRETRRLARLRGSARAIGVAVALESVPDLFAPRTEYVSTRGKLRLPCRLAAHYALAGETDDPCETESDQPEPPSALYLRMPNPPPPIEASSYRIVEAGWARWIDSSSADEDQTSVHEFLGPLPSSAIGVRRSNDGRIAIIWDERNDSELADIHRLLQPD